MTELQTRLAWANRKTLLSAVEFSHAQAGMKPDSFKFAKLDEFNSFIESFNFNDFPAHLTMPWSTKLVWLNGRIKTVANMQGWIFMRIPVDANEFRSRKVEELYLQPMRNIAKDFFRNLLDEYVIDQGTSQPDGAPVNISIDPEYAFLSSQLFGVSYSATIPIIKSIKNFLPDGTFKLS